MKTRNGRASSQKMAVSDLMIHLFFIVLSIAVLIPFILVISISLTDEKSLLLHGYHLFPQQFSLLAYTLILHAPTQLLRSYQVTILVTVVGTAASLLLTSMVAYSLSRRDYRYRRVTTLYVFFTMLFSGGLVPLYILVTQYLGMKDTIFALIIPYLVSPFYILVMKGFLDKLPVEIIESAKMDGASEWRIFFTIVLPLSTPALATLGLFISFMYWNDWWLGRCCLYSRSFRNIMSAA
jgi:putative aldouronate transport system permease protein